MRNSTLDCAWERRMCTTGSGRLTMCPAQTKKDDVIIYLGEVDNISEPGEKVNCCCVLRKKEDHYSLVGMCYVYGNFLTKSPRETFIIE